MASSDAQHYYQIVRDELRITSSPVACRGARCSSRPPSPTGSVSAGRRSAGRWSCSQRRARPARQRPRLCRRRAGGPQRRAPQPPRLPLDLRTELGGTGGRASWESIYDEVEAECSRLQSRSASSRSRRRRLGEHFAVSRTVVRDVLNRMHGRNLIVKDRRSHWIAGPLSARMLDDYHELRRRARTAGAGTRPPRARPQASLQQCASASRAAARRPRAAAACRGRRDRGRPPRRAASRACATGGFSTRSARPRSRSSSTACSAIYLGVHDESEMLLEHRLVFDHLGLGDAAGRGCRPRAITSMRTTPAPAPASRSCRCSSEPEIAPYLIRIH